MILFEKIKSGRLFLSVINFIVINNENKLTASAKRSVSLLYVGSGIDDKLCPPYKRFCSSGGI